MIIVADLPLLSFIGTVLDEHTLPIDDLGLNAGSIEAGWILSVLCEVQGKYREYGTI